MKNPEILTYLKTYHMLINDDWWTKEYTEQFRHYYDIFLINLTKPRDIGNEIISNIAKSYLDTICKDVEDMVKKYQKGAVKYYLE